MQRDAPHSHVRMQSEIQRTDMVAWRWETYRHEYINAATDDASRSQAVLGSHMCIEGRAWEESRRFGSTWETGSCRFFRLFYMGLSWPLRMTRMTRRGNRLRWHFPLQCLGAYLARRALMEIISSRPNQGQWLPQCFRRRVGGKSHLSLGCDFQINVFRTWHYVLVSFFPHWIVLSVSTRVKLKLYIFPGWMSYHRNWLMVPLSSYFIAGFRQYKCTNSCFVNTILVSINTLQIFHPWSVDAVRHKSEARR